MGLGQPCSAVAFKPREGQRSQLSNLPVPHPAPAVSTGLLGKGQSKPDDLTWWKGKFSAFFQQKTFAKCNAERRSRLGFSWAAKCIFTPNTILREKKLDHISASWISGGAGVCCGQSWRPGKGSQGRMSNEASRYSPSARTSSIGKLSSYSQKWPNGTIRLHYFLQSSMHSDGSRWKGPKPCF